MKYPGIFVGRNSSGSLETKQWQDMIANPRQSGVVWHRSVILFSSPSCGENFVKFLIHKIFHHYPGEEKRSKLFLYMNKVEMYEEISVQISITSWG